MEEIKWRPSQDSAKPVSYRKPPVLKDKPDRRISGFLLPPHIRQWLKRACKDTNLNRSEYVTRALKRQIEEDYGKSI